MRVLLTGAAGRLGSEVCRHFHSAGIDFRGTDRGTNRELPVRIDVADIRNREACYPLAEGCDAVVHLANHPNSNAGDTQSVFSENCAMNINIFQAAMEAGAKKIVFASSVQTMTGVRRLEDSSPELKPSSLPYLPLDGHVPANPGNPYAASKVAGETLLQYFSKFHGISGVAARFPMLLPRESIARWRGEPERVLRGVNLDEAFSLLTYADAARLIIAILRTPLDGFRTYFPTARAPWLALGIPEIVDRFYPTVPLRRPREQLTSLVDLSEIQRQTGWLPEDEPQPR